METKQKSRWQRFKEWWTIDHVVDLCVDALLLIWEVVSSPILIVVRIIRHFIGDWFVGGLKNIIKKIVRWFANKREYRKAHGHGIFRTYWYLILTSPIIFFILVFPSSAAQCPNTKFSLEPFKIFTKLNFR